MLKYEQVKSLFTELCRKSIVWKSHHLWCFTQTDWCECKLSSSFSFSLPKKTGSCYPGLWKHRSSSSKSLCSKCLVEKGKGNQVGWWTPDQTMSTCTAVTTQLCDFTDWTLFWYLKTDLWCDICGVLSNSEWDVKIISSMQAEVNLGNYSTLRGLTSSPTWSSLVKRQIRAGYSQLERTVISKIWWHCPLGENLEVKSFFRKQSLSQYYHALF